MENTYNQYNIEALFRDFLLAENVSSITLKNYLSDYRYFEGWLTTYALVRNQGLEPSIGSFIKETITKTAVEEYKRFLLMSNLPTKTINRRLSTLRRFCSFCVTQGWLSENPAKHMINVKSTSPDISDISSELRNYEKELINKGYSESETNFQLANINEFLQVTQKL